jgi:diguanylate cyclase (GGDEF)-like protein/putative nucleotidyltransferase with HDIG domain
MSLTAKLYITAIIAGGLACFWNGLELWTCRDPFTYLCLLGLAIGTSLLKVTVPGRHTNISVSFIVVLLSIIDFSYPETLVVGCLAAAVQAVWRKKHLNAIQFLFNLSTVAIAVSVGYAVHHGLDGTLSMVTSIAIAAIAYFLTNTITISAVIGLTTSTSVYKTWRECHSWLLPYYLLGAAIAIMASWGNRRFGLETSVLVLPAAYFLFRAYRLYLERLESATFHAEDVASLHLRTVEALAMAIEAKDLTTHDHLQRVQVYAVELGKALNVTEEDLQALRAASILHDIGKLAVPEHIISKPGKLTSEEFEKMKIHPVVGAEILERVGFPYGVVPIVRFHHEKWNGAGYPDGLKGEAIPLGARILSVVDCFDALVSDRQYRRALPLDDALAVVVSEAGKGFDPRVVEALREHYRDWEKLAQSEVPRGKPIPIGARIADGTVPTAGLQAAVPHDAPQQNFLASIAAAAQEAQGLFELGRNSGNSLNLHETLSVLDSRMRRLIPYDAIAVYVREKDRLIPKYVNGETMRHFSMLPIALGQGISGSVAASGRPIANGDPSVQPGLLNDSTALGRLHSALAIPLEFAAGITGVLTLYHLERDAFTNDHLRVLLALKSKLSLTIENTLRYQQVSVSATTDGLTALPNARTLFLHLDAELTLCKENGSGLAMLLCNLDGFKEVNDRFGHLKGDKILKLVSAGLRDSCREMDYVARMGGDEFVLVLPGLGLQHLDAKLRVLEKMALDAGIAVCGEPLLSLSIGAVSCPEHGRDAESLLAEAERRMYLARRSKHHTNGRTALKEPEPPKSSFSPPSAQQQGAASLQLPHFETQCA